MKQERATEIAAALNDTGRWKSHARGLSMEVIKRDLNLKIDNFGEDLCLRDKVNSYYRLLKDYMDRRGQEVVIHTARSYRGI